MSGICLSAIGITVCKGLRTILQDINLSLLPSSLTFIIGPNGAGKSTLLRALSGLEVPSSGSVVWQADSRRELQDLKPEERARSLAWIPDSLTVPFGFTALEAVIIGRYPWHRGHPGQQDRDRAEAALARLGVGALAARPMAQLSSGEKRKIMLARALAGEAPVLLFDEPCANLDVAATLEVLELLRSLASEGRTVAATLHDLTYARRFASHALIVHQGRLAASGKSADVCTPDCLRAIFGVEAFSFTLPAGEHALAFSSRPDRSP